jgi:hypothetical protein
MKYTKYPAGRIDCESNKCGEWHHGGHDLNDLLPEDTLQIDGGNYCCLGCGKELLFGLNANDLTVGGTHAKCLVNLAARVAMRFGSIDGAHHKHWVIDQMLRAILGAKDYQEWCKRMISIPGYENDPWDTGIAP